MLLRLGVSGDGGGPLRVGSRDGQTSASPETPGALEACLALGLDGVVGIVAASTAESQRTLGGCLEKRVGLLTLVPRPCAVRQALEAWGQPHRGPLLLAKPGRTRREPPRQWRGQSVVRHVAVEESDGQVGREALRLLGVPSSQLARPAATADTAAHAKEAARVTEHRQRVEARWLAWGADAAAAVAADDGRGHGRRGRTPRPWRYHALHYRVEAVSVPKKRPRRGRPSKAEAPPVECRSRLVVHPEALGPSQDAPGWTVLATTVPPAVGADTEMLQAYQEQKTTGEPGFRWIKHPAALSPVGLEKPERMAALAMLTVVGFLVYAVLPRPGRRYLREHNQHLPGTKGLTAVPTAAGVFALFASVMLVQYDVDQRPSRPVHGLHTYHLMVGDAVGIDHAWYQEPTMQQNSSRRTTPP